MVSLLARLSALLDKVCSALRIVRFSLVGVRDAGFRFFEFASGYFNQRIEPYVRMVVLMLAGEKLSTGL